METSDKAAYTIIEAAHRASSSRTSLYNEIKAGRLKATKIGARTIIKRSDFDAWLDAL